MLKHELYVNMRRFCIKSRKRRENLHIWHPKRAKAGILAFKRHERHKKPVILVFLPAVGLDRSQS